MGKRVFIVHRWEGVPEGDWYPWLKEALEKKGFEVFVPAMPHPEEPEIEKWVPALKEAVGTVDEETHFVGHSIGSQTIIRYLTTLSEENKVGKVVFLGGWLHLLPSALEDRDAQMVAKPWIERSINWERAKSKCDDFTAFFSDNDPFVPIKDGQIFEEELDAVIIIEHGKGHFTKEDGVVQVPEVIRIFTNMDKEKP